MKYMEILEGSPFTQSLIKKLAPPLGKNYSLILYAVITQFKCCELECCVIVNSSLSLFYV